MTENIQPVSQEEFEDLIKEFKEVSPNVANSMLDEEEPKLLFIGRSTCQYSRKYLPKLIAALGEDVENTYFLNSENTATDDALADFRFEVGAKTVPSLVYVGGDGRFTNLAADSSNSVEDIKASIER
ncbi:bacterocin transport accessory protein [Aerococcus agrisoli]|uniref:Bacterocin transport accessory protein n=1 Tax=Aerococcus agrisoli TaxID=2487350 RepID=A0A3N4GFC2_9LACT|nr:bacterocin transport accessory protein [Aerococcus agrisoli]RPA60578.1 bacterocin transport accessory protein [Aerococcus agrisoli]